MWLLFTVLSVSIPQLAAEDAYVEMRPIKNGEVCVNEEESPYVQMNPATLPHQSSVPSLPSEADMSALYPPPSVAAPVYAHLHTLLPPNKGPAPASESLHYASRNLLYSERS